VNILPNNLLGIVGAHEEFPIERLALNHNGELLASISHDQSIKFWNIGWFYDLLDEEKKEEIVEELAMNDEKVAKRKEKSDFFSDL